jgi:Essential protein Yae1, N terminal
MALTQTLLVFNAFLACRYHAEGHAQGLADGSVAGLSEGRTFGLESAFKKFLPMGQLHGRADMWRSDQSLVVPASAEGTNVQPQEDKAKNERLQKHIYNLYHLTNPGTLSTVNGEEEVADFDDRLRRGQAKAKLVARILGEDGGGDEKGQSLGKSGVGNAVPVGDF